MNINAKGIDLTTLTAKKKPLLAPVEKRTRGRKPSDLPSTHIIDDHAASPQLDCTIDLTENSIEVSGRREKIVSRDRTQLIAEIPQMEEYKPRGSFSSRNRMNSLQSGNHSIPNSPSPAYVAFPLTVTTELVSTTYKGGK